jgi:large subunit ribosomal protein L21
MSSKSGFLKDIGLMYAIIRAGGKQLRVSEGELVKVEKVAGEVGDKVSAGEVLSIHDGKKSQIGRPVLDTAKVEAEIVRHGRGDKIRIHKFKRRQGYARTQGHRQPFTELKIEKIKAK